MTDAAWDEKWFTANGGALDDEVRFRTQYRQREDAVCDEEEPYGYGLPHGDLHPFDYLPDLQCCTVDERRRWLAACRAAESGEPFEAGNHSHLFTGDGRIVMGGTDTPWGIGSYINRWERAA